MGFRIAWRILSIIVFKSENAICNIRMFSVFYKVIKMYENRYENRIFVSMQEMMEQLDVSDKTLHRLIEEGELPDFTYGSKWAKKKGWHKAVLERHAMEKYERSKSIQNACNPSQIATENVTVVPLRRRHQRMPAQGTDFDNRYSSEQQLGGEKVSKSMGSPSRKSRIAAGFPDHLA